MTRVLWLVIVLLSVSEMTCYWSFNDPSKDDEIHQLPGLYPQATFKQFSGYLNGVDGHVKLFYWLLEATHKSDQLPLVLWLNGGPGCSSLLGLFTENGPFKIKDESALTWNPYSWNKVSNLLYLETPARVGYSYTTSDSRGPSDNLTAADSYQALQNFLIRFPAYYGRDIFLTGESYAGVYLPLLALKMIEKGILLNIKGVLAANPYTDLNLHDTAEYYYLRYRGLIPNVLWNDMKQQCCKAHSRTPCLFIATQSYECREADSFINKEIYTQLNYFNMYSSCQGDAENHSTKDWSSFFHPFNVRPGRWCKEQRGGKRSLPSNGATKKETGTTACLSKASLVSYLNKPSVREALHINGRFDGRWVECNNAMFTFYRFNYLSMLKQYRQLLEHKIPLVFLSGDFDLTSPHLGTKWFVDALDLKEVSTLSAWFYSDGQQQCQLGGYYEKLELYGTPLWYATVHAAGHMIPADNPEAALHLITAFIRSDNPFD